MRPIDVTDKLYEKVMERGDQPKDRKILNYLDGSNSRKDCIKLYETENKNLFLYGDVPYKGVLNVPNFVSNGICRLMEWEPERVFVNTSGLKETSLQDVAAMVDTWQKEGVVSKTAAAVEMTAPELC